MLFNVPQNINVEDKIAGPLTAKQLMWMFGMGAIMLVMYVAIPKFIFYVLAIPVALLFLALAFFRPNGQPLIYYVVAFCFFLFRPKVYVWKRTTEVKRKSPENKFQNIPQKQTKVLSRQDFASFARVLDTRGTEADERVMEYLRKKKEADQKKQKGLFGR